MLNLSEKKIEDNIFFYSVRILTSPFNVLQQYLSGFKMGNYSYQLIMEVSPQIPSCLHLKHVNLHARLKLMYANCYSHIKHGKS